MSAKKSITALVSVLANEFSQIQVLPEFRAAQVVTLLGKLDASALKMIDAQDVKWVAPLARLELENRKRAAAQDKKLAQLPAGWRATGAEDFRLDCADGMHCQILKVKGGYVVSRMYGVPHASAGYAQSGAFCKTWKEVVEMAR